MAKKVLMLLVCQLGWLGSTASAAPDLELSLGKPVSELNLDARVTDARLSWPSWDILQNRCQVGPTARVGYMELGADHGWRFGSELLTRCAVTSWLSVGVPLGVGWVTDYFYADEQDQHHKNLGGPWQFLAGVNVGVQLADRWALGYELSHMSNWNNYNKNPTLNTHNLFVRFSF